MTGNPGDDARLRKLIDQLDSEARYWRRRGVLALAEALESAALTADQWIGATGEGDDT